MYGWFKRLRSWWVTRSILRGHERLLGDLILFFEKNPDAQYGYKTGAALQDSDMTPEIWKRYKVICMNLPRTFDSTVVAGLAGEIKKWVLRTSPAFSTGRLLPTPKAKWTCCCYMVVAGLPVRAAIYYNDLAGCYCLTTSLVIE
jgi:hypothetical protein